MNEKRQREILYDIPFIEDENGCWICTLKEERDGYPVLRRGGKRWRAHRLSFTRCKGPIPEGLRVLHTCDTPRCIRPRHLWAGTQVENVADMDRKGRRSAARHEEHGSAKLDWSKVRAIRASTEPATVIAPRMGVSPTTICKIRRGELWRN